MPAIPANPVPMVDQDMQQVMLALTDLLKKSVAAIKAGGTVVEVTTIASAIMTDVFPNLSTIAALPADAKTDTMPFITAGVLGVEGMVASLLA